MKISKKLVVAGLAVALSGAPAWAHTGVPGHEHGGLVAGLLHPAGGLDHLLAMIAVGIWSAVSFARPAHIAAMPVAFVLAMLAGAGLGISGIALPLAETGIALSVIALGLLIMSKAQLPLAASCCLVALFALCHGYAHGAEASGSIAAYMVGFTLTTGLLHVAGIGLGRVMLSLRLAAPVVGAGLTAAGAYILAS